MHVSPRLVCFSGMYDGRYFEGCNSISNPSSMPCASHTPEELVECTVDNAFAQLCEQARPLSAVLAIPLPRPVC